MASPSQIKFIGEGERQIDISFFSGEIGFKRRKWLFTFRRRKAKSPLPLFPPFDNSPPRIQAKEEEERNTKRDLFLSLSFSAAPLAWHGGGDLFGSMI